MRQILRFLGWNRTSYYLMSSFILLLAVIVYAWWPLVVEYWSAYNPAYPLWMQLDWLLLAIFGVMSLLIMAGADLRHDLPIVAVGLAGGLVIEAWGTQTHLWNYFTLERPPLWIIPAWPIASLSIDRIQRLLRGWSHRISPGLLRLLYPVVFGGFMLLMLVFVWPTLHFSLTRMALFLCLFLVFTPTDAREMLVAFLGGSLLGYFLERWGTTRECWVYYTYETPPFFAVLAHGMAAVAFWRAKTALLAVLSVFLAWGRGEPAALPVSWSRSKPDVNEGK